MKNINDIAKEENKIYIKVLSLIGSIEEKNEQILKLGISEEYRNIHQKYAELSNRNIEALKRGLFLQWYVCIEPTFLTGIGDLNPDAQDKIIEETDKLLENKLVDEELNWMLNYYKNWNFAFEKFTKYKLFYSNMMNNEEFTRPKFEKSKWKIAD